MSRPRSIEVLEELQDCPIHGKVPFRRHKHGRRPDGQQRYRWVCVKCHNIRQLAAYYTGREGA